MTQVEKRSPRAREKNRETKSTSPTPFKEPAQPKQQQNRRQQCKQHIQRHGSLDILQLPSWIVPHPVDSRDKTSSAAAHNSPAAKDNDKKRTSQSFASLGTTAKREADEPPKESPQHRNGTSKMECHAEFPGGHLPSHSLCLHLVSYENCFPSSNGLELAAQV